MSQNSTVPSREEVLHQLAEASLLGGLGLFVGTGFSIAATEGSASPALSWGPLLERAAEELELAFPPPDSRGMSYSRMASELVRTLRGSIEAEAPELDSRTALGQARTRLKETLSRLTAFELNPGISTALGAALAAIRPAWIVTTNYDLLIEQLLPDSDVLLPREVIPANVRVTPVYHLHGHRLAPDSLVITEEDYVETLGFGVYRQIKLSLLFSESTTLLLGYGLGDVNVLTAIEWARSYSSSSPRSAGRSSTGSVIQTLWRPGDAGGAPYWGDHDELIVPIEGIASFFEEIRVAREKLEAEEDRILRTVEELTDPEAQRRFLAEPESRQRYLDVLVDYSTRHGSRKPLELLDSILEPQRSWEEVPFEDVAVFLDIILDIFERWADEEPHPALFNVVADKLARISWYIGEDPAVKIYGKAWDAQGLWHRRKTDLPQSMVRRLRRYAEENGHSRLSKLLRQT